MIWKELTDKELFAFSELMDAVLSCVREYHEMADTKREEEAKKVLDGLLGEIL